MCSQQKCIFQSDQIYPAGSLEARVQIPRLRCTDFVVWLLESGWFSTPVMGERVGISGVAEKERQRLLKGLSGQLCCTIPPRDPVPSG